MLLLFDYIFRMMDRKDEVLHCRCFELQTQLTQNFVK